MKEKISKHPSYLVQIKDQMCSVRDEKAFPQVGQPFVFIFLQLLKHLGQVDDNTITYNQTDIAQG